MNGTGKRIRVMVADDSAFMRKVLQSILIADPQLEVIGEARDGREAVSLAESLKPDVITMDINMPHMDGLQATEVIMSSHPRPIVIVSSESREGADTTLKALELGAIDFVAKPSSGIDLDMNSVRDELLRKLKMASKVRVVRTAVRPKTAHDFAAASAAAPAAAPA
ncbi:MAG TPA: response regulator, partial [Terriglobales bacterium]|nr:response regulator [Terriglobales bacterium]